MKTETTYIKTLGKVEAKLSRMKEQAAAVRWFYENGNLPESYNRALRLEELSEQTVLLTRVLPAYTGAAGATVQTDAIISDTIPVEVGFTAEGWFSIRIPALLPKKASGSADYIRSYLYPAMRKFFEGKPPVRFRDCVLAYRHVYDRSRPERAMRDHDNIETNMVTDILALVCSARRSPGSLLALLLQRCRKRGPHGSLCDSQTRFYYVDGRRENAAG